MTLICRITFTQDVNTTWYSVFFDHKLTKLFSIENFSGAKPAGKVLIIIIILFLIIIIIVIVVIISNCNLFKKILPLGY